MISLILSFIVLIVGYLVYSKVTEKMFSPDNRKTPAIAINDGIDCVPMPKWKTFLVQLLNIAGTGPIFGALMGICFGPVVFLWIIFGSILGGAVHDFYAGMISSRHKGASIAELSGTYLWDSVKWIMRVFTVLLLVLTGTVFITTPADLLVKIFGDGSLANSFLASKVFWVIIILIYYMIATVVPIDKIIGKIYPIFGIILIVMCVLVLGATIVNVIKGSSSIPELWQQSTITHPNGLPVWPFMFVTVACGAISGFHSTQSPMIAKCIKSESEGRPVFYGAMIVEAAIALVWAAAGVAFYGVTNLAGLQAAGGAGAVYAICKEWLGVIGMILAIIGVAICPITSGDTAFRAARLTIAETFKLDQKSIWKRFIIAIPLFLIAAVLCLWPHTKDGITLWTGLDFDILWRYFAWSNQTLAMITLWVSTGYLLRKGKYKYGAILTAIPTAFMCAVTITYILMAPEGFMLSASIAYPIGIGIAFIATIIFIIQLYRYRLSPNPLYKEK